MAFVRLANAYFQAEEHCKYKQPNAQSRNKSIMAPRGRRQKRSASSCDRLPTPYRNMPDVKGPLFPQLSGSFAWGTIPAALNGVSGLPNATGRPPVPQQVSLNQ